MPLLCSYGTLQDSRVQLDTFGRRLRGERDVLPRFQVTTIRERAAEYANVERSHEPASCVEGTAFEVTDDELAAADAYERPASYGRILVALASGRQAWVYVRQT